MNTILVTGGAGFIGSNFVKYYLNKYPSDTLINLDDLTYAGNLENLKDIENNANYHFIKGSICDKELLRKIFKTEIKTTLEAPNLVAHFAAESHVDRSIKDSSPFIQTNVVGTQILLDTVREFWSTTSKKRNCFLHVSTDEVYGSLGKTGLFTENNQIKPNSPYSASKASSDLLVRAYYKTFNLPVITTRCSNNYGPYQFPEKLIPLIINNIINKKPLPIYGQGLNIRDWLFVLDHCAALDTAIKQGKFGEVYNIGGNNEWTNIDIVKLICKIMDEKLGNKTSSTQLINYVTDRPGHDLRYAIDATKIKNELGWEPEHTFEKGIVATIDWYLENQVWLQEVTSGEYQKYYNKHYL